jgi:hypothetical protein
MAALLAAGRSAVALGEALKGSRRPGEDDSGLIVRGTVRREGPRARDKGEGEAVNRIPATVLRGRL